jgi:hypothetical protein
MSYPSVVNSVPLLSSILARRDAAGSKQIHQEAFIGTFLNLRKLVESPESNSRDATVRPNDLGRGGAEV